MLVFESRPGFLYIPPIFSPHNPGCHTLLEHPYPQMIALTSILALLVFPETDGSIKDVCGATTTHQLPHSTHKTESIKLGLTPSHALQIIIDLKQHNIILRHSLLVVPPMRRVMRDFKPFLAEMWVDYVDSVQVCWCYTAVVADGKGGVGVCAGDTA